MGSFDAEALPGRTWALKRRLPARPGPRILTLASLASLALFSACGQDDPPINPDEPSFVTEEIPIAGIAVPSDGKRLFLQYEVNAESKIDHAEVSEVDGLLEVGLVGSVPGAGAHTLAARAGCHSIRAELPDGARTVIDLATQRHLKLADATKVLPDPPEESCPPLTVE